MGKSVLLAAEKIRRMKIQGARNVAITAIKALEKVAKESRARQREEFLQELLDAKEILFASRQTEPFMRNAVRYLIHVVKDGKECDVAELQDSITAASTQFLEMLEKTKEEIARIGSKRIRTASRILTHCHSSTVSHMLTTAKQMGKSFEVFCTETRPRFQGRITAEELVNADIETTMIVDSAVRFFMNEVNVVFVGADAITSEGNIVNKIGTSMIALVAREARTPFYVVSELLKFDPLTIYGDFERIEEREPREIWRDSPLGLIVRNPAFEVTRRDFIHGIICEEGIISPHSINEVVRRRYPWIFQ